LFGLGFILGYWKLFKKQTADFRKQFTSLSLVFSFFTIVLAYVLIRKPAMYDGMRHFFFILPPIFIFIGFAFEFLMEKFSYLRSYTSWLYAILGVLFILPGINGIIKLHPYEYAYYNSFIGGTDGAFRNYETDYWLTCYKESIEYLNQNANEGSDINVFREAYIATGYGENSFNFIDIRKGRAKILPGDYVLINTRTNEDRSYTIDIPVIFKVERGKAVFCIVKQAQ